MSSLTSHSDDEQWAPVSDLMAVIMLIFMLIAMILFVNFNLELLSNKERCAQTRDMLNLEFKDDFEQWGAELTDDLTIRFTNQNVFFKAGSANIENEFAEMLHSFFPRYMKIIKEDIPMKFGEDEVKSIRIEGHTSSEYKNLAEGENAYIKNMELSQNRARKILQYVLSPQDGLEVADYGDTAKRLITANGLSSSHLICINNVEDKNRSRRVEFKLLTDSCQKSRQNVKFSKTSSNNCLINLNDHV